MSENPLVGEQREKSGAQTFSKYRYQYHWALYKIIEMHKRRDEYVVFVELHEDVVIGDSLNGSQVFFDFNQVKSIATPKYNVSNLTAIRKGKSSVFSKLVNSLADKHYSGRVKNANLVASCGFSLKLSRDECADCKACKQCTALSVCKKCNSCKQCKTMDYDDIKVSDLADAQLQVLKQSLKSELGIDTVPKQVRFVTTDLDGRTYEAQVVSGVVDLIECLFPKSNSRPRDVYRALYDELTRKGIVVSDFLEWNELVERKGLTSKSVNEVLHANVDVDGIKELKGDLNNLMQDLKWSFQQKRRMESLVEKFHLNSLHNVSLLEVRRKEAVIGALKGADVYAEDKEIASVIDDACELLGDNLKGELDAENIKAMMLYGVIRWIDW